MAKLLLFLVLILHINTAFNQILTPPYFNLAYQKEITATATCGGGISTEERYCKLTGSDPSNYEGYGEVIQGQLCDLCVNEEVAERYSREDPKPDPEYWSWRVHKPESAVDGSEKWWQSPPLSRGLQYNEVDVSIDLGQEFHVAYVFIKMANSPRPGVFALDRSVDNGLTWKPWQYFADTISDCYHFFGDEQEFTTTIVADDSVICTTQYSSVVPLENGEIAISLVNERPGAQNFTYSPILREWTKATNVRLRLIRTKTLLGHLMAVNVDQDPTVTRRYFYSIKDISIGGRCVCNGHADACSKYAERGDERKLICNCRHNTCGDQCETCCPGFVQKPWKPATPEDTNECEPCQCYGHSNECYYDEEVARNRESVDIYGKFEGGGVCQNCRHNTEGVNCERCSTGFFRPEGIPVDSLDACQPCNCDLVFSTGDCEDGSGRCICRPEYTGPNCERCSEGYYGWPECRPCDCNVNGTLNGVCAAGGGQCPCKPQYDGQYCDNCAYGYYDFPYCRRCNCDGIGALDGSCEAQSGQCRCKNNHAGRDCGTCASGFYNYPACNLCQCDPNGCTDEVCDVDTGTCLCKENFAGARCDRCALGYYNYPFCVPCNCQNPGSQNDFCAENGQCQCNYNFAGISCDKCAPGFYNYPSCLPCNCDSYGSWGKTCHRQTGQCDCRPTFAGLTCSECRPNYYNYPNCEECNCNPAGAKDIPGYPLGGCGTVNKGILCECKDRVTGRICDSCKQGYFNLNTNNPQGCEDCDCFRPGTTGNQNFCDGDNGQCVCKTFTQGRRCDQCQDGMYNLRHYNHFGCQDCMCDVGGTLDHNCAKSTGQCNCRPRVGGRACDEPIPTHYFPTLYHHKYEMEDGKTARGGAVRYGVDENRFPSYSWRGYAILSRLQEEVLIDVTVTRTTLFRIVYSFVNTEFNTITGEVKVTSDQAGSVPQTAKVYFPVTGTQPSLVSADTTVYLPAGRWTFSLKSPQTLFVDYMVLLPREYYEASVLQQPINSVCKLPMTDEPCKHYVYVNVSDHPVVKGEQGTVRRGSTQERTQLFPDRSVADQLGAGRMAYLDSAQTEVSFSLPVLSPGKYYLVMLYHSTVDGRTQDLKVDLVSDRARDSGLIQLASCPYTSLCRQVVVDNNGDAKSFDFKGNYASISFTGPDDIDLAVDSVIAIPADQWNLELIQPRMKCVMQNQKCVEANFQLPTGSVRVEVEAGRNQGIIATDLPPNIMDTTVKVVKADGSQPTVNVQASVDRPGPYVFVVHYYQPFDIGFDINVDVLVGLQTNKGQFRADYCPGVSGCRAAISFDENSLNGHTVDLSEMDFLLAFNNSRGKPVWLDNILVIPAPQFSPSVLDVRPVDKSAEFINSCGSNNFYIDTNTVGFCRDGVFSLTTDYNNGAMSCECNSEGSTGFSCMQFGGQCRCRPDIIGRDCSRCRNGYYGFPDCRPCNCQSGLCDDRTGQCTCPPRVTGDNCNVCLPQTFGFDPLIGCEECNCDPQGVLQRNLECDVNTGQCSCRDNVAGRRCDECRFGFYNFPQCQRCSCSPEGTEERICNNINGRCVCKENVEGPTCGNCVPGTYNLDPKNPRGCSQCFCFGETSLCQRSNLRREEVMDMTGWAITNLREPRVKSQGNTVSAEIDQGNVKDPNRLHYWIAPLPYLGNKVTAYGGLLRFTVNFEEAYLGISQSVAGADVRIEGNNMSLTHLVFTSPQPGQEQLLEVQLLENNFVHERNGNPVSRQQFMMVLARIDAIQIRASYYDTISETSLSDVVMETASESGRGEIAHHVEQCVCPPSYTGPSCENCTPGYFRAQDGPHQGRCIPCRCNGRSDTCDPETGICSSCKDSFTGPQCLRCMEGHYEDPFTGRCEPCACPGFFGNNFAHTCEVTPSGVVARCICKEGYAEPDCGYCENGYWGNPKAPGGKCELCACSGNIDVRDRLSCDISTGACLRCINNATGHRCERCKDWFWGDAVRNKDCKMCTCNQVGSQLCDPDSGTCLCKPNVVGPDCDRCAPGTYGFESGNGCQRCDCAEGAFSGQCDLETGQCSCRPGVTGRRCDQCERGYWGYSIQGCRKCDCESDGAVTCSPVTGVCQCLPGVTGPKCDSCLPRWALVKDQGCKECDQCVTLLLDDLDDMYFDTGNMIDDLTSISVGVTAIRRLKKINDTVTELRPKVDGIISNPMDTALLDPMKEELLKVQELAKSVRDRGQHTARSSDVVQMDAEDAKSRSQELMDLVIMAVDAANEAVKYAEDILQDILNNIKSQNVEQMLQDVNRMLQEIQSKDFSERETKALEELENAKEALNRALNVHRTAQEQANRTMSLGVDVEDISDKLKDLLNNSKHSLDNSKAAIDINANTNATMMDLQRMLTEIKESAQDAQMMEEMANDLLEDARNFLLQAAEAFVEVEKVSSQLDSAMEQLDGFVKKRKRENEDLSPVVRRAMDHALSLQKEAERLDSLLADTRESSEGALNASRAYQAIVDAIETAMMAAEDAIKAAEAAKDMSNGLADSALDSREASDTLWKDSQEVKQKVQSSLRPRLDQAIIETDRIGEMNSQTRDKLDRLNAGLDMLPEGGYGKEAQEAADKAMDAEQKAQEARDKIQVIKEQLPDDMDKVREIPQMILGVNRDVIRAQGDVDNVISLVPQIDDLITKLDVERKRITQIGEDLSKEIAQLRENIKLSRGEASRIEVGVEFGLDVALQVRNPSNLHQAGGYGQISMFFRTEAENGFLAYVGPDAQSRQQFDDYMSLEVAEGKLLFTFDLGDGPTEIVSEKVVSDGAWHQVIAERMGKTGTLTVRTDEEENDVQTGSSVGTKSVFDINPDAVMFFVGGVPSKAELNGRVQSLHFEGCIEEVKFDGQPVGLWDFVDGENNNKGCAIRDVLTTETSNEFRFEGDGYLILDKDRFRPSSTGLIRLEFRTYSENGLLFLMGEEAGFKDFLSIELKDGHVLYQFDLGSGVGIITSDGKLYNDGEWHHITANRKGKTGLLKIDSETVGTASSRGRQSQLNIGSNLYVGGYKGTHAWPGVTNTAFEGCIRNLELSSTSRDLNDNKFALNVFPGCQTVSRIVSFNSEVGNSFIAMDPVDVNTDFEMTMKVRGSEGDGVLFYVTGDNSEQAFSVVLKGGRVVMTVAPGEAGEGREVIASMKDIYNDGRWHFITVTKQGRDLQLNIDDIESLSKKYQGGKKKMVTTTPLYFGGFPPGMTFSPDNVAGIESSFIGCVGDVTVNGNFINFAIAAPTNMRGVSLSTCTVVDPVPVVTVSPTFPTFPEPQPTGQDNLQCALPLAPAVIGGGDSSGTRFGDEPDSRLEYEGVPDLIGDQSSFSLEFKTDSGNGVLFYVAGTDHLDFLAVYMRDGLIHYDFDCGTGAARIVSLSTYNDGQWHAVKFTRDRRAGSLQIDGIEEGKGTAAGSASSINVLDPFFIGGIPPEITELASTNLQGMTEGFIGCIRKPQLNEKPFDQPSKEVSVSPCSSLQEPGTFFADRGHVQIKDNFVVGLDKEISMEVRARTVSGVLASVYSEANGEYLVLQLINGEIVFNVYNGRGDDGEGEELRTVFTPSPRNSMCDGKWHTIVAQKNKNVVRVQVDGVTTSVGVGVEGVSYTDTNDPLYIGGVPARHGGIKATQHFVGCIRNVKIDDEAQSLSAGKAEGSVQLDACPVN